MGSSPVTATTLLLVRQALEMPPALSGRLCLAFSGGPDSLGLLLVLKQILGDSALLAAHVDHGSAGAGARRVAARKLADHCGVDFRFERRPVDAHRQPGESWEAAARRVRYQALEEMADAAGIEWIATAHHQEDQAETLILRLRQGSDWMGLAGVAPRRGRLVRPALAVSKWCLRSFISAANLAPIQDATNRLPRGGRNLTRLFTIPQLLRQSAMNEGQLTVLLSRVAESAARARDRLSRRSDLARVKSPAIERFRASLAAHRKGVSAPGRAALEATPGRAESAAVFTGRGGVRWNRRAMQPCTETERTSGPSFSYTFSAPGRVELPQLGVALRVSRARVQPWMFQGREDSAGFQLTDAADPLMFEVRPRRPGDRLRPLGSIGSRKLKDVLIDRRVPAESRDRLPLLVHAGKIVWVPGVTVDEDFRLQAEGPCWVARLEPLDRCKEAY